MELYLNSPYDSMDGFNVTVFNFKTKLHYRLTFRNYKQNLKKKKCIYLGVPEDLIGGWALGSFMPFLSPPRKMLAKRLRKFSRTLL